VISPLNEFGRVTAYDKPASGLTERPDLDNWKGLNPYSSENQPEERWLYKQHWIIPSKYPH